jgi:rubredoxin
LLQSTFKFDVQKRISMKKWQCIVCGFTYDEEEGLVSEGLAPGTKWDDIPDDWCCPECGVEKADFEMVEVA